MNSDMKWLKAKVDAGAEYIVTQMFFDNSKYFEFVDLCKKNGITVPIIPGLKILSTKAQIKTLPKIFKIDIPHDFYEALEDVLIINDEGMGPTGINKAVVSYFLKHGTLHYREVDNGDGPFKIPHYYEPRETGMIVSPQIDHMGLLRGEKDLAGKKAIIDKLSTDYGITWRNRFGASPLFVMQMNRGIGATDRAKLDRMRPQLSDIADSSNPAQDANVVLGIFSPTRYGIPQYEGYDVAKLRERFRAVSIMKNRSGESDKMVGTRFIGETGDFTELPPPKDMLLPGAYERALTI